MKKKNEEKADFLRQLNSWFQQTEKDARSLCQKYESLFEVELRNDCDFWEEDGLKDLLEEFTDFFSEISKYIYRCRQNLTE